MERRLPNRSKKQRDSRTIMQESLLSVFKRCRAAAIVRDRIDRTLRSPHKAVPTAIGTNIRPLGRCMSFGRPTQSATPDTGIPPAYLNSMSGLPVISAGCSRPINFSTVGATSANTPL